MKRPKRSAHAADRNARPSVEPARPRRWWIAVGALLIMACAGVWFGFPPRGDAPVDDAETGEGPPRAPRPRGPLPPPAPRAGRHRNTTPDVAFVGTGRCVECHDGEHDSFLHTPHSQALGRMGDGQEPPDGAFTHAPSGITFETRRDGDRHVHRAALRDEAGDAILQCEFPIEYHIGSGNHSRSYLVRHEGFLFESPLTWYRRRDDWGLSPGYEAPLPRGFERMVDYGCLVCHAGRVETDEQNRFRPRVVEGTIGCESCHGPGALHVEYWRDRPRPEKLEEEDLTIVNPARLGRDEAEQICSFCHLRGSSTIAVRGQRLADFRPGLQLADFRVDFTVDDGGDDMKVTGHVEQMRRSKCYASSPEMTCITCHDPHARPEPAERPAYFRQKCVDCHDDRCGLAADERRRKSPTDDCVACHMPRGDTDIPHFAFTHHRIGIHATERREPTPNPPGRPPALVPTASLDYLPEGDQLRSFGLAYVEYSERQPHPADQLACRDRGRRFLRQAYERGVRDAATLATLAGLEMELERRDDATQLAREALRAPNAESGGHANARFVLAHAHVLDGDWQAAEEQLARLVQERYRPEDWLLYAEVQQSRGRSQDALQSLLAASRYNPFRPDVQEQLSLLYARLGDKAKSNWHHDVSVRLVEVLRKRRPAPTNVPPP